MFKWMKRLLILAVLVLVLGAVVVSMLISRGIRAGVESFGPKVTGTPVTLHGVSLAPWSGGASMTGFTVGNPEGFKSEHAFYLEHGSVKIQLASLTKDVIVIDKIHVTGAEITYELGMGKSNIGVIRKNVDAFVDSVGGGSSAPEGAKRKVIIKEFVFEKGKVRPTATVLQGASVGVPIPTITLTGIGEKSGGETVAEAIDQITTPIFNGIESVVSKAKDVFSGLGASATEKAKGALDKIKDIVK